MKTEPNSQHEISRTHVPIRQLPATPKASNNATPETECRSLAQGIAASQWEPDSNSPRKFPRPCVIRLHQRRQRGGVSAALRRPSRRMRGIPPHLSLFYPQTSDGCNVLLHILVFRTSLLHFAMNTSQTIRLPTWHRYRPCAELLVRNFPA